MAETAKALLLIPDPAQAKEGSPIVLIPQDSPFGMQFREKIDLAMAGTPGGTGTTATVSVTGGPDADTDPPDSDSD